MGFNSKGDRRPYVKPVTKVEVSEKHFNLRAVLAVLLFAIGIAALMFGLNSLLSTESGWNVIETTSSEANCSADFILNYNFQASGGSATAHRRQITQLYSDATERAYLLFSKEESAEGLYNVHHINTHVNQQIQVDGVLYKALELIGEYRVRALYLAPVYEEYDRIFLCSNETEASWYDPAQNPEQLSYVAELAAYANDPDMIHIELLGDNRIRLNVADEYLRYAQENEIDSFVDFGWMKNAFIADYIAEVLTQNGFTHGYIASYDGFTRNLDDRGEVYTFNVMDRYENGIYLAAKMDYREPMSIVFLRDYPMTERDRWHYFSFGSGRIATTYIDAADGADKSAVDSLTCYSADAGCARILMQMIPLYIADSFDEAALKALSDQGVDSIWCEDTVVCHTDADLALYGFHADAQLRYSARHEEN